MSTTSLVPKGTLQTHQIPFAGGFLEACLDDGKIYVSITRVCEHLGLAKNRQMQKLADAPWAVVSEKLTTGFDGKSYEMAMIEAKVIAMWLANINHKKLAPELRDTLIKYQCEAVEVLAQYFMPELYKKEAPQPEPEDNMVTRIKRNIEILEMQLRAREQQLVHAKAIENHEVRIAEIEAAPPITTMLYKSSSVASSRFQVSLDEEMRTYAVGTADEKAAAWKRVNGMLKYHVRGERKNWGVEKFVTAAELLTKHFGFAMSHFYDHQKPASAAYIKRFTKMAGGAE